MTRKVVLLALLLISAIAPLCKGQSIKAAPTNYDTLSLQKLQLISDLKSLDVRVPKLDGLLARALSKTEIADAAWTLDQVWAEKLLREAYELTFPEEAEQERLRSIPVGTLPPFPNGVDRARGDIRGQILSIANRDKAFAQVLAKLGAKNLGTYEEHLRYSNLASVAFDAGDKEAARQYLLQSIEADPTQIAAGLEIQNIAARDRALADQLIIDYIERLRAYPLSTANQSSLRTHYVLTTLMFSNPATGQPSAAAIRTYLSYLLESLDQLDRAEPGYLRRARGMLMMAWPLFKQYAPELIGAFLTLEQRSRNLGEDASLPSPESINQAYKDQYEKRIKDNLGSDQPDESVIRVAIGRGDFDKARKMIAKLADGSLKTQLAETVNMQEALSLAAKGDIPRAQGLAEQLKSARSMLQVYPAIITGCIAVKDQTCATLSVYRAVTQLRRADTEPAALPVGIPAPFLATNRELDPVLLTLSKLAKAVAKIDGTLALQVLDEMVLSANRTSIDTTQGRAGFEADVFRVLAKQNETGALQAAGNLINPVQQVVALAEVYQFKAEQLKRKAAVNKR